LANRVVTEVRQRVVRETHGRRGRASDPVWASRRRLLRGRETLSERAMVKLWSGLLDGDPTNDILTAWIAKEELRALLATAKRGGVRSDIANRLDRFYAWCAGPAAHIPEVVRLAATVTAWWPEILAFLTTNITNPGTEGTNHLIKDAARVAFGFRNLDNQRRRVRWACTHRQRLAVVIG
jgi:transposase